MISYILGRTYPVIGFTFVSIPAWSTEQTFDTTNQDWSMLGHFAFSFVVVIAIIMMLRLFLLRWQPMRANPKLPVRVIGGVSVGPRERVVAVDIENERFYLAVSQGSVRIIYHSPCPDSDSSKEKALALSEKFQRLVKKEKI
ncbi:MULTISPECIES: FliO/MopB family protein [Candidatus Ichthyocystis]|uniref:FliO/MopB family protein n=1 Tax=Candidatus Ichthyocystis TaxID=2929841 RepID=UPI000B85F560|nr:MULTISPECIES: flagellar biosynthetic protein FliO [Ichthyocystis]